MAAGDITIAGSNFTPADFDKIAAEVTIRIASTSKDPGQYEVASSLQGITSIPVFHQSGSTYKLVRVLVSILKGVDGKEVHLQVSESGYIQWRWTDGMWNNLVAIKDLKGDKGDTPVFRTGASGIEWKYTSEEDSAYRLLVGYDVLKLKFSDMTPEQIAAFWHQVPADVVALFQKPATDAAARVDEKMVQLSEDVNQIIEETTEVKNATVTATENAGKATDAAIAAVGLVGTAIENAKVATDLATDAAELAEQKAGLANTAAGVADLATEKANTAAGKADTATTNAEEATIRLDALSDHRDIIKDGYWWQWNETTKEYEKTGNRADGNTLFASFAVNLATAELEVTTPDGYDGPVFSLEEGNLCVIV